MRVPAGALEDKMECALEEKIVRKVNDEVGIVKGEGAHCEKIPYGWSLGR